MTEEIGIQESCLYNSGIVQNIYIYFDITIFWKEDSTFRHIIIQNLLYQLDLVLRNFDYSNKNFS